MGKYVFWSASYSSCWENAKTIFTSVLPHKAANGRLILETHNSSIITRLSFFVLSLETGGLYESNYPSATALGKDIHFVCLVLLV